MSKEMRELFNERLGRYHAAISLEPLDRIPIASGSNYFAEVYSGYNKQQIIYDSQKWLQAEIDFIRDFPEVDVLRNNRIWAPLFDAVGCNTYRLPGRDLPPDVQFQFVEGEYMKDDEYDALIETPSMFMLEYILPRIFGEMGEKGSPRSYIAMLKGGMAQMMAGDIMRNRSAVLAEEYGMPQPMTGAFLAPFDVIADVMRGLRGVMMDIFRQPDNILKACDALVEEMAFFALSTADPHKRYPIFVPTHKACFLSPEQFEKFYWPSFKKVLEILIDAGYTVRAYLEGNWGPYWHHFLELPKGRVICDIDSQGDIFQAKKDIGHHQCIAGGIPESLFILGTPEQMREQVKTLCETVGKDGGYIINGGCNIPYDTRPENYRAMIDATLEFGTYDSSIKPAPRTFPEGSPGNRIEKKGMFTPWEEKLKELNGIKGDEELIKNTWENLERKAYTWVWQWVF